MRPQVGQLVFVRFFGRIEDTKKSFQNQLTFNCVAGWPLVHNFFSICLENHQFDTIVFKDSQQCLTIYNYLFGERDENECSWSSRSPKSLGNLIGELIISIILRRG